MSRYAVVTWAAIAIASVLFIALPIPKCTWAVAAVWAVYIPIFVGGMGFIGWNFFARAVCRVDGAKAVALTFDDGPDSNSTPQLLDLLRRENIKATFFCVGQRVEQHPQIAARIAAEGHLLANHSYHHPWYISMMREGPLTAELQMAQSSIESAAGVKCDYFRPPSGMTSRHFPKVLKDLGLTLVGWDVRSLDTVGSSQAVIQRVLGKARDGSIILLHDGGVAGERVIEIVSAIVRDLRARGFEFQRVDRLIDAQSAGKSAAPIGSAAAR
jgi:peptidoglycan/xylan/chitin deacetylase (PgdA/CDA1 family)